MKIQTEGQMYSAAASPAPEYTTDSRGGFAREAHGRSAAWALVALLAVFAEPCAADTLIFADNFNAPDNSNFDNSDQTGRRSGTLANDVQLRSARIQHGIVGNQLNMLKPAAGGGRVRFQSAASLPTNVWWDFASSAAGSQILADGGLRVDFDWTPANNTSNDWVSYNVGFPGLAAGEPQLRVNHAETDFGILFRNNGGTQYFDNAVATTGNSFDVSSIVQRHVSLVYRFNSFADGSDVTVSASVDGVSLLNNQPFRWENNSGALYMELGNAAAGTLIDNLSITSIPEPSTVGLLGSAMLALGLRRRRR